LGVYVNSKRKGSHLLFEGNDQSARYGTAPGKLIKAFKNINMRMRYQS